MKNLTNGTLCTYSVPNALTFEVMIVITSALIITISSLVIKEIYPKLRNSRVDLLFIILSISDIGVGLLKLPSLGLHSVCITFFKCSPWMVYLTLAANVFPYFSYTVTTIVAVDRLLVIRFNYKYKKIVTVGRLKIFAAFCFFASIGHTCFHIYGISFIPLLIVYACIVAIAPIICIAAYAYLLFYVQRHSSTMSHCKVSGKNNDKRLYKALLLILVSQLILSFPWTFIAIIYILEYIPRCTLFPVVTWFQLLLFSHSFVIGTIYLINQRKNVRNMKAEPAVIPRKNF